MDDRKTEKTKRREDKGRKTMEEGRGTSDVSSFVLSSSRPSSSRPSSLWLLVKWLAVQLAVVGWMAITAICPGLGTEEMEADTPWEQ